MNKKKKSTNISPYPDEAIERLARAFYPAILACWNSEEGQRSLVGARPLHLACARPFCCSKAPRGLSLLRCASQTRSMRFERSGKGQELSRGHKFSILENFLPLWDSFLLGRACPKPCQIKAKGHYLPRCFSFRFCCFSSN